MISRTPKESLTVVTDLVLPSETNPLGNMFGGELLARMDRAASISARRHCRRIVTTVSVNHVAFSKMIPPSINEIATVMGFSNKASIFLLKSNPKTTAGIKATNSLK